jgi:hypothetical protein
LPTSGDPGKLTTGIIGSVLGNKAGGLGGVLGGIGGKRTEGDKKPQNAIDSILDTFGKKKKKQ